MNNPEFEKHLDALESSTNKPALRAVIREDECIGCTKCIKACPIDSIVGSKKKMHTVMSDECSGCELCVAPCPMDCIDMIELPSRSLNENIELVKKYSDRYEARNKRLEKVEKQKQIQHEKRKLGNSIQTKTVQARQSEIMAAIQRARQKKKP